MINAIIFDVGGVLVNSIDKSKNNDFQESSTFQRVAKKFTNDVKNEDEIRKLWNTKFQRPGQTKGDFKEFTNYLNKKYNKSFTEKDLIEAIALVENYEQIAKINPNMIDLVKKLKTNYKVAILSNTVPDHVEMNKKRNLFDLFDVVVNSCDEDVQLIKPDKEIFDLTLKRLGVKSEEVIFIDDRSRCIEAAQKLDIKTILFKGYEALVEDLKKLNIKW